MSVNRSLSDPVFRRIARLADEQGVRAYVVGGYVRDHYLRRPSTDIDVVVVGSGIALAEALGRELHAKSLRVQDLRHGDGPGRRHRGGVRRRPQGVLQPRFAQAAGRGRYARGRSVPPRLHDQCDGVVAQRRHVRRTGRSLRRHVRPRAGGSSARRATPTSPSPTIRCA